MKKTSSQPNLPFWKMSKEEPGGLGGKPISTGIAEEQTENPLSESSVQLNGKFNKSTSKECKNHQPEESEFPRCESASTDMPVELTENSPNKSLVQKNKTPKNKRLNFKIKKPEKDKKSQSEESASPRRESASTDMPVELTENTLPSESPVQKDKKPKFKHPHFKIKKPKEDKKSQSEQSESPKLESASTDMPVELTENPLPSKSPVQKDEKHKQKFKHPNFKIKKHKDDKKSQSDESPRRKSTSDIIDEETDKPIDENSEQPKNKSKFKSPNWKKRSNSKEPTDPVQESPRRKSTTSDVAEEQTESPVQQNGKSMFKFPGLKKKNSTEGKKVQPEEADSPRRESTSTDTSEEQTEKHPSESPVQKDKKSKFKIPNMKRKSPKNGKSAQPESLLDFNQNLEQNKLFEASQQLIDQEDRLYSKPSFTCDEENNLEKDHHTLKQSLQMAVDESFKSENKDTLRSAVLAILQQEKQDKHYVDPTVALCPIWRPMKCRQMHDLQLQEWVEARLLQTSGDDSVLDRLSTSLKREVCRMGTCVQKDLIWVVKKLQQYYPPEYDICNVYAQLYHKAFSRKLLDLCSLNIDVNDGNYILSWIYEFYPKDVLQHEDLEPYINTKSLEPLLPEKVLKPLQEQYLLHKETVVREWLMTGLQKEQERWQAGKKPESFDGYFCSNLTSDILPLLEGAMKEAMIFSGDRNNAQRILFQLDGLLNSYKTSIDNLFKEKYSDISDILKGNLVSIMQLREYVEKQENLPEKTKSAWLDIITNMRDSCHGFFLRPIHKELKVHYRQLWTPAWFTESHVIIGEILGLLKHKIKNLTAIHSTCKEELMSQLHLQITTEYVRRMLKGKLKLNRDKQETAASYMCEDNARIKSFFIEPGSKDKWLCGILPSLSELVRLHDTEALRLEVITLARTYSDFSKHHLCKILQLKENLTSENVRSIKLCLAENRESLNSESTRQFFCKVPVK